MNYKRKQRKLNRVAASHACWKSSPAICTNGEPQMFFKKLSCQEVTKASHPYEKGSVSKLLSICKWKHRKYRTLKQIGLPVLEMGSHQKSQMPSILLSTNSALQCETPTWPCSHALQWWSKVITLVPLFSPVSVSHRDQWEKQREKIPPNEKCYRDMYLPPWNRREQILKPGGF